VVKAWCGFEPTTSEAGADTEIDSNGSPALVVVVSDDSMDPASSIQSIDFGYVTPCKGKIGNFVWYDKNRNGLQNPCEQGIDGVIVKVMDLNRNALATTISGPKSCGWHGYYQFDGLCPGTYIVEAVTPAGYLPTLFHVGSNLWADSDAISTAVELTYQNPDNLGVDFGYIQKPQAGCGTPGYWKNHPEAWPGAQTDKGVPFPAPSSPKYEYPPQVNWRKLRPS